MSETDNKSVTAVKEPPQPMIKNVYDWIEVFCLAAAFVVILFTFVARICSVSGESMTYTLSPADRIIVSNMFYTPEDGDIIVIQQPGSVHPIIKRVIATGGQTVDIDFDSWTVYVDNTALEEDYVRNDYNGAVPMHQLDFDGPVYVPEGYVFVLGDNRNNSLDSRDDSIGLVSIDDILGKLIIRIMPLSGLGTVE